MSPKWLASARRLFRTVPELDQGDKRSGATFVNILFGLVVTQAAIQLAKELVKWWGDGWNEVDETRLAHLLVALTLTVLSWIGYHQSQQYPPFLIKFVNIPFVQFFLDVLMVIMYYVVVAVAENSDHALGPVLTHSAGPEASLVFVVFVLYSVWDFTGFRLFHDPEYSKRLATPREADSKFGPRRWVTFIFTLVTGGLAMVVWQLDPETPGSVVITDAVIFAVLFLYRICKQASDPKVKTRAADNALDGVSVDDLLSQRRGATASSETPPAIACSFVDPTA